MACCDWNGVFFLQVDPSIRSMMALQEERGSTSYSELQNEVTKRSMTQQLESKPPVLRWNRLPGQVGGMRSFLFDITDELWIRIRITTHSCWLFRLAYTMICFRQGSLHQHLMNSLREHAHVYIKKKKKFLIAVVIFHTGHNNWSECKKKKKLLRLRRL